MFIWRQNRDRALESVLVCECVWKGNRGRRWLSKNNGKEMSDRSRFCYQEHCSTFPPLSRNVIDTHTKRHDATLMPKSIQSPWWNHKGGNSEKGKQKQFPPQRFLFNNNEIIWLLYPIADNCFCCSGRGWNVNVSRNCDSWSMWLVKFNLEFDCDMSSYSIAMSIYQDLMLIIFCTAKIGVTFNCQTCQWDITGYWLHFLAQHNYTNSFFLPWWIIVSVLYLDLILLMHLALTVSCTIIQFPLDCQAF